MVGNDDVKQYDEKSSDGGEVSSPVSQNHHNTQHSFAEGEEVVVENKNSEGEEVVQIEWDLKSQEGEFKSKDVSVESSKKVRNGVSSKRSSSSSSSSSSDDESHDVEKKTEGVETVLDVESVKTVEYLPEELTEVIGSVGEVANGVTETEAVVIETVPLVGPKKGSLMERFGQLLESTSVDSSAAYSVVDLDSATEVTENKLVISSGASDVHTSNGAEHVKDSQSPPEGSVKLVLFLICSFFEFNLSFGCFNMLKTNFMNQSK